MRTQELLGKRVISTGDDSKGMCGTLIEVTKGRYPFIVKFDSGSCYGVTEVTLEKSDREKAIEWFGLLGMKKYTLLEKYDIELGTQHTEGFKIRIEDMWRKETQSSIKSQADEVERVAFDNLTVKPQVDFERLNRYIKAMNQLYDTTDIKNLCNFFELMSKSSAFAHKAHKELNRLKTK